MKNQLLILILFIVTISSVPTEDIVLYEIPGYNHTWYSGYLTFNTGKYHYIYFESQKDPEKDPVNWWFNGGPGCSSLMGMFYENGPFVFQQNTDNLKINPYSWNRQSNLLYMQTPGGVGFSHSYRNNTYSDQTTTQDNLKALLKFYQKFPNLKKNQLYLSGQSYAGVYVPFLAKAILEYNKLPSRQLTIALKGFMVNNACTDPRQCYEPRLAHSNSVYQYEYLWKHGFYTDRQYQNMAAICLLGYNTKECADIRSNLDSKFWATNTSIYNIYIPCLYQNNSLLSGLKQSGGEFELPGGLSCQDSKGMLDFLNKPAMHQYLHVDSMRFQDCSEAVSSKYIKNPQQSYPIYKQLLKLNSLRIWVTTGDHDADVPMTGTLAWIQRIRDQASLPIQDPWRQWWIKGIHKHEDQVGGMTWGLRGLKFATIKGGGHMAHKDKRQQSWVMVDSFLKGNNLPYQEE